MENNSKEKPNEDNKNKEKNFGLYLIIKTSKNSNGVYDASKIDNIYETTMTDNRTFLMITKNNQILKVDNHSDIKKENGEHLLFKIRRRQKYFQLENNPIENMKLSEDNINRLNYEIWYVINNNNNINEQYYLNKNDIIRFGNFKFVLKKININNYNGCPQTEELNYNIKEINKEKLGTIITTIKEKVTRPTTKKECCICNSSSNSDDNPLLKICDCDDNYKHYNCIKEDINDKLRKKNKNKTSFNYFLKSFCIECKKELPLEFKIGDRNYTLFKAEKPPDSEEYLLFESLSYLNKFNENEKSIHLVKLTGDDNIINVTIGRDGHNKNNDIKIEESSVSREHAIIEYNKNEKTLLLKNISKSSDSLILIHNVLEINEKKINLQVGNTSVEANLVYGEIFKENKDNNKNNDKEKNINIYYTIQSKSEYQQKLNLEMNEIIKKAGTDIESTEKIYENMSNHH